MFGDELVFLIKFDCILLIICVTSLLQIMTMIIIVESLYDQESTFVPVVPATAIPAVRIQCERGDYQVTVPMYARQLIVAASKVSHPSSALMHHCYGQKSIKV